MISVGRNVGKLKLLYIDVGCSDTLKNVFAVLQMSRHRVTMSTINYYPIEMKKYIHTNTYMNVHESITDNSQKGEIIPDEWIKHLVYL